MGGENLSSCPLAYMSQTESKGEARKADEAWGLQPLPVLKRGACAPPVGIRENRGVTMAIIPTVFWHADSFQGGGRQHV